MSSKPTVEFNNFLGELGESVEKNQEQYKKHAERYDEITESWGYKAPQRCVEVCMSELKENSKESSILDVASGTGLVGYELRKAGFLGNIDGIDASKEMVDACTYAEDYRSIKVEMISKDQPLPYEDISYNATICSGCLSRGHIPHESLKDVIRILKPGGLLVFNIAILPNNPVAEHIKSVGRVMDELIKEGKCAFVKEEVVQLVDKVDDPLYSFAKKTTVYCYKKL